MREKQRKRNKNPIVTSFFDTSSASFAGLFLFLSYRMIILLPKRVSFVVAVLFTCSFKHPYHPLFSAFLRIKLNAGNQYSTVKLLKISDKSVSPDDISAIARQSILLNVIIKTWSAFWILFTRVKSRFYYFCSI